MPKIISARKMMLQDYEQALELLITQQRNIPGFQGACVNWHGSGHKDNGITLFANSELFDSFPNSISVTTKDRQFSVNIIKSPPLSTRHSMRSDVAVASEASLHAKTRMRFLCCG